MRVHLKLFGGAVITDSEAAIEALAARRHPVALLALLATASARTLSRGKVVGLLWPEVPEKTARNRLTSCVYNVRRALGDEALVTLGDDLRLDGDVGCDVSAFDGALKARDYENAVDLYAGPFLDGFALDGSRPFEEWMDGTRRRLQRAYRRALESLAVAAEERSEAVAAERWWGRLAAEDPFDSRVVHRWMQALSAAGNPVEALRAGRAHERLLRVEFQTEPDDKVRELIAALGRPRESGRRTGPKAPGPALAEDADVPAVAPDTAHAELPFRGEARGHDRESLRPLTRRHLRAGLLALLAIGSLTLALVAARYLLDAADARSGSRAVAAAAASTSPRREPAARELYVQAEKLRRIGIPTAERNDRMVDLYQRALELDPAFAEAWAGLANAYVGRAWMGRPDWADSARAAARRAIALDPTLASAYTQLGDSYWPGNAHYDDQLAAYMKALELDPTSTEATNNLAAVLGLRGDLAEAVMWLDRGQHLDPESVVLVADLVLANAALGRDSIAEAWLEYARARGHPLHETEFLFELFHRGRIDPARKALPRMMGSQPHLSVVRARGALALYQGSWAEARSLYREVFASASGASYRVYRAMLSDRLGLAWALDRLGQHAEAKEVADDVVTEAEREIRSGDESYLPRARRAVAELIRGDTATALEWLERAVDAGYRDSRTMRTIPVLDPLRGEPRFQALQDRVETLVLEERRRVNATGWGAPRVR